MKAMKNIKTPTYATKLEKGLFMAGGQKWQCSKCGMVFMHSPGAPSPRDGGTCRETSSGNHIWVNVG